MRAGPRGPVTLTVIRSRATFTVTPRMFVSGIVQYNSTNRSLGSNMRLRWEYLPGSELFVAFGQSALIPDSRFVAQRTQASVRLGHTFRF